MWKCVKKFYQSREKFLRNKNYEKVHFFHFLYLGWCHAKLKNDTFYMIGLEKLLQNTWHHSYHFFFCFFESFYIYFSPLNLSKGQKNIFDQIRVKLVEKSPLRKTSFTKFWFYRLQVGSFLTPLMKIFFDKKFHKSCKSNHFNQ